MTTALCDTPISGAARPALFGIFCVAGVMVSPLAMAGPMDQLVEGHLAVLNQLEKAIIEQDALLQLILDANVENDALDEDAIMALDGRWREGDKDVQEPVLTNALSLYLSAQVKEAGGRVGEIIVMDDKGLTVAAWPATSDYLQGDEAKFQETYDRGTNGTDIARVDFDDSTGLFQQQISKTVNFRGRRIGALTIGLDIAYNP